MRDAGSETTQSFDRRRVAHVLGFLVLVAVVGVFVASAVPQIVGADESYTVLSDSMSPSIEAGAVVFVSDVPAEEIATGDVITYERAGGQRVTHRVVEVVETGDQRQFRTQGDANDTPDPDLVHQIAVIGEVSFHVPLMGYVVNFARSSLGIVALVVIPALLLIGLELWDLWRAAEDDSEEDGIL